jgi:hypothetical protein
MKQKHIYQHDCDSCHYLGTFFGIDAHNPMKGDSLQDLYVCNEKGSNPTIIARASDEPSDYASGLLSAVNMLEREIENPEHKYPIAEAVRRAVFLKFLTPQSIEEKVRQFGVVKDRDVQFLFDK